MIDLEEKRAKQNLIGKEGTIIDATIVEAPIQHNSKEENEQIKQEEIPQGRQGKSIKLNCVKKIEMPGGQRNRAAVISDIKIM